MEFRTVITVQPGEPKIDYSSKIFLLGSCFVENIGDKLDYFQLQNLRNPFGILYHPSALEEFIEKVASSFRYTENDVFLFNERWHSFEAHSSLSDPNPETLLDNLNRNIKLSFDYLREATHVVITLGTSWGYRNKEEGKMVANCHKIPNKHFSKELLRLEDIEKCLRSIIKNLRKLNPEVQVIFTVSPVRHLKDGIVENQRSKANLLAAVHNVIENDPDWIDYFPAYEIVLDDLRDYRFFKEDMLHPNSTAIDYVWKLFTGAWFSGQSFKTMEQVEAVRKGLSHKPFNPASEAHQKFLGNLTNKIHKLKKAHTHINFKEE